LQPQKKTMTADDHQHWPDDETWQTTGYAVPGYDDNNGLHTHTYYPSGHVPQQGSHAQPPVYQQYPAAGNPEPQYHATTQQPQYYAYPPSYMVYPTNYYPVVYEQPQQMASYAPAPQMTSKPQSHAYAGRTKAQVMEDNCKIAKREGANNPRKVEPIGVKDTDLFWFRQSGKEDQLR
jgi:hypothetical protein